MSAMYEPPELTDLELCIEMQKALGKQADYVSTLEATVQHLTEQLDEQTVLLKRLLKYNPKKVRPAELENDLYELTSLMAGWEKQLNE